MDDARSVYEKHIRLIEEDEACAVEAAHLNAALKRNAAHRKYLHAQEKALLSAYKKSSKADGVIQPEKESQTKINININNNQQTNATFTNSPTYDLPVAIDKADQVIGLNYGDVAHTKH